MTIENFLLEGSAGRIECLLKRPRDAATRPAAAAVVCHPHPLFGGTMHNKVVHAVASAMVRAGIPTLRFNFRGVGLSGGKHDGGRGEQEDLRLVIDHLASRYPGLPLLVAGYSFGSYVALGVGCEEPRAVASIGIGLPVSLYDFTFLASCDRPVTILQGGQDQFGPLASVKALAATAAAGARLLVVEGADHGFEGRLDELSRRVDEAIPPRLRTRH